MKSLLLIFGLLVSIFCFGADSQVREVQRDSASGMLMKWIIPPKTIIKNEILKGYDRDILIYLETDESGWVQKAEVSKSSGLDDLDNLVLRAVKRSKLKVWNEWDIKTNHPSRLKLPFEFSVSRVPKYEFFPNIVPKKSDLKGESRSLSIYVEADNSGKISKTKVTKSSGINKLDNYVLKEFKDKARFKPLNINGKPYPIKETEDFHFPLGSAEEG
ncbi:hypothetical protein ASC84_19050 [Acinetobacter sp. Root1280]|uniref:energy transducer TonB n=1 Tax=Acinetobacter sp. Root1280 TaxID=1736444 RepID=UPI000700075E|nr:energy transducer TonB [Acinetobacter sp. Root1280]KQX00128.1 hypothetical protein ASC84_19050 [Acinetobacter sp. Root1280]